MPTEACYRCLRELLKHGSFSEAVWSALMHDPLLGVQVLRDDGSILFINDQSARLIYGPTLKAEDCISKNARELLPAQFVEERITLLKSLAADGKTHVTRGIVFGRQIISTLVPLAAPEEVAKGGHVFLALTRHVVGPYKQMVGVGAGAGDSGVHVARTNRLGSLECLSPRELEILAMIGLGLSTPEISRKLSRSANTINDHRKSIARKLGVTKRARLAEVAQIAGLTPEDATRVRS
jgi:DNA-binding CsgD family transcriptional regulator